MPHFFPYLTITFLSLLSASDRTSASKTDDTASSQSRCIVYPYAYTLSPIHQCTKETLFHRGHIFTRDPRDRSFRDPPYAMTRWITLTVAVYEYRKITRYNRDRANQQTGTETIIRSSLDYSTLPILVRTRNMISTDRKTRRARTCTRFDFVLGLTRRDWNG